MQHDHGRVLGQLAVTGPQLRPGHVNVQLGVSEMLSRNNAWQRLRSAGRTQPAADDLDTWPALCHPRPQRQGTSSTESAK